MSQAGYVEKEYTLSKRQLYFDTRSLFDRAWSWLEFPQNWTKFYLVMTAASLVLVPLMPLLFVLFLFSRVFYIAQTFELPVRMPKDLGGDDASDPHPETGTPQDASGIFYLGVERSMNPFRKGREVWLTNSDDRMHKLVLGTTGAGKTRKLLGYLFNALAWGSGGLLCDGKGDNELAANVSRMARFCGRDTDLLFMNFLRGGEDIFKLLVARQRGEIQIAKTNSFNPNGEAGPDMITQLVTSLLAKAEGDSKTWQDKAINMFDGVVRLLCFLRANGEIPQVSFEVFREYLALPKLCEIYRRAENDKTGRCGGYPPAAYLPIKSYLSTGLPGFNGDSAKNNKPQTSDANTQHGYLTGQFARTLGLMCDTYGDVFRARFSEINMRDVALNNRILVIILPALEKSPQEISNLGRLVVAAAKLMMAQLLGDEIEGDHEEIIESKVSKGPTPFEMLWDEVGYYFSDGFGSMVAQGRSIGTAQCLAGQDLAAMSKGGNEDEVEVVVANTKLKEVMASEDPKRTRELVTSLAGEDHVSRRSGDELTVGAMANGYRTLSNIGVEKMNAVEMRELKGQTVGQSVMLFMDRIVRVKSFDPMGELERYKMKHQYRICRFVEVVPPTLMDIESCCSGSTTTSSVGDIAAKLKGYRAVSYPDGAGPFADPVLNALRDYAASLPEMIAPVERGIALFEELCGLLDRAENGEVVAVSGDGHEMPFVVPQAKDALAEEWAHLNEDVPLAEKPIEQIGSSSTPSWIDDIVMAQPDAQKGVATESKELGAFAKAVTHEKSGVDAGSAPASTAASPVKKVVTGPVVPDELAALGLLFGGAEPSSEFAPEAVPLTAQPAGAVSPGETEAKQSEGLMLQSTQDGMAIGFTEETLALMHQFECVSGTADPGVAVAAAEEAAADALVFPSAGTSEAISDSEVDALFGKLNSVLGRIGD